MAFGFPPRHRHSFPIEDGTHHFFLAQAVEAAGQLGWEISFINESGFIAHTRFSMASWTEQVDLKIKDEQATLVSSCTGNQLFDWGKNKTNVNAFLAQLQLVKEKFGQDHFSERFNVLQSQFALTNQSLDNSVAEKNPVSSFLDIFKPVAGYTITPVLLNLNLLVFVLMAVSGISIFTPDGQSLVDWGANFRPSTMRSEWWRLLTACFIHIGVIHLLLNLYALVYIGILLEPYLKKTRFITVYLASGVIASACSLWWHDYTVSAGASGAIFGLYGVFLALLTTNILHESVKKSFLTSTAIFIAYNLLNGLKPDSGVDNAAHIGGLLSGLVMGYVIAPGLRNEERTHLKIISLALILIITFGTSVYLYKIIPNDYAAYDDSMARFSELEDKALHVFNLPENTRQEVLINEIREHGLPGWYENLKITSGIEKLHLPSILKIRNGHLKKYCELRIKHYQLLYKALSENSDSYDTELKASNEAIRNVIAELSE